MSALAYGSHAYGRDLFVLAGGAACEAREVSCELTGPLSQFFSLVTGSWEVKGGLKRLARRQGQLLDKFAEEHLESWEHEDCKLMATALDELIVDERDLLQKVDVCPRLFLAFWKKPITELKVQFARLEDLCLKIDALSVRSASLPGDEEMRDFLEKLGTSEEYDFSVD